MSEYDLITFSSQYVPLIKYPIENKNDLINESLVESKSRIKIKANKVSIDKTEILYGENDNVYNHTKKNHAKNFI